MVAFYGVLQIIVTDGGKQPLMRPGYHYRGNIKFKQHMVYQKGDKKGMAKGLRTVIAERYGDEAVKGNMVL